MTTEDNNGTSNGPDDVNEPGGSYQPQQPLTFEKVWLMFCFRNTPTEKSSVPLPA